MLVTALNQYIGYDKAVQIAKTAASNNSSLLDAAIALNVLTPAEFKLMVNPENMLEPKA